MPIVDARELVRQHLDGKGCHRCGATIGPLRVGDLRSAPSEPHRCRLPCSAWRVPCAACGAMQTVDVHGSDASSRELRTPIVWTRRRR